MNASCISSNNITYSCHVHASCCCICLCFISDTVPSRQVLLRKVFESTYQWSSAPLLIYQASKPPCSFRYNPSLSLLLKVIPLGQQRFNCYFVLRQLNPFLCMTCHCHSKQLKPTSMCRSCLSHVVFIPCIACYCLEYVRSDSSGMNWSVTICYGAES